MSLLENIHIGTYTHIHPLPDIGMWARSRGGGRAHRRPASRRGVRPPEIVPRIHIAPPGVARLSIENTSGKNDPANNSFPLGELCHYYIFCGLRVYCT